MLKITAFAILLAFINSACAQSAPPPSCTYSPKVISHFPPPENGEVLSEIMGVDPDSQEKTITHTFQYTNGDTATIEQKYCSMYNLHISYNIKTLDDNNFDRSLSAIGNIIRDAQQDYQLKAPLQAIVDMTMNQKKLSINAAYEYDLPYQSVKSSENVEHSISFKPLEGDEPFEGNVTFYVGLGGE